MSRLREKGCFVDVCRCVYYNEDQANNTIVNQRTLVWKRRQTSNEYSIILL